MCFGLFLLTLWPNKTEKSWGLSDEELATLSAEAQLNKLSPQWTEIEALISSKSHSRYCCSLPRGAILLIAQGYREGLVRLASFYANDPVARQKALAEVKQLDEYISFLQAKRLTISSQLEALKGGGATDEHHIPETEEQPAECVQDPLDVSTEAQDENLQKSQEGSGEEFVQAEVLYTFEAQTEGEISVAAGTTVTLLEEQPSGDW